MKTKAIVLAMMFLGTLCVSAFIVPDVAEAKCIYCGTGDSMFGDCPRAPSNDNSNPQRKHKHQFSDKSKCVWCGANGDSQRCPHSPTGDGKHQR